MQKRCLLWKQNLKTEGFKPASLEDHLTQDFCVHRRDRRGTIHVETEQGVHAFVFREQLRDGDKVFDGREMARERRADAVEVTSHEPARRIVRACGRDLPMPLSLISMCSMMFDDTHHAKSNAVRNITFTSSLLWCLAQDFPCAVTCVGSPIFDACHNIAMSSSILKCLAQVFLCGSALEARHHPRFRSLTSFACVQVS